jgi:hypothetical protein
MRSLATQTVTTTCPCLPHALVLATLARVLPSALPPRDVMRLRHANRTDVPPALLEATTVSACAVDVRVLSAVRRLSRRRARLAERMATTTMVTMTTMTTMTMTVTVTVLATPTQRQTRVRARVRGW